MKLGIGLAITDVTSRGNGGASASNPYFTNDTNTNAYFTDDAFQNRYVSNGGVMPFVIPWDFRWQPSFNIYENGRTYTTDFNFDAIKPIGTEVWISPTGSDTTGTGTEANPYITVFKAHSSIAGIANVKAKAGTYLRLGATDAGINPSFDMSLECPSGLAIFTRAVNNLTWTQQLSPNDSVWMATRTSVQGVIDTTAPTVSGEFLCDGITGLPTKPSVQTSIANCQANPNSYYYVGSSLYVRTWNGRAPDSSVLVSLLENIWNVSNLVNIWMDRCENWGNSGARHNPSTTNTNFWAWRNSASRFGNGSPDGLEIQSSDYVYSINCQVTDMFGPSDGFNYHSEVGTTKTKALEVNCFSRRIGQNSGLDNMNGTTAHDNASIIRLNCNHQYSYGPLAADVLGAHSLNLGCTAGNSLAGITGQKSSYQVGGASESDGTVSIMYVRNCTAIGSNYALYNVSGPSRLYNMGGFIDQTSGPQSGNQGTITTYPS